MSKDTAFKIWLDQMELSAPEAAELLGISRSHAYSMVRGYTRIGAEETKPDRALEAFMGNLLTLNTAAKSHRGQKTVVIGFGPKKDIIDTRSGWRIIRYRHDS